MSVNTSWGVLLAAVPEALSAVFAGLWAWAMGGLGGPEPAGDAEGAAWESDDAALILALVELALSSETAFLW